MNNTIQTDSIMNDLPKCTLCGEPAICIVRDCAREMIESGRYKYTPMSDPEWRCKKHNISTVHDITSIFNPPSE